MYLNSRHNHQAVQPGRVYSTRGFTLLELLVTLSIAAILLAVAIPSYRGVVQRNAMASQVNDLVGDLNYARSEAVTRGVPIHVCKSADQATCTNSGGWEQGWIVYQAQPDTPETIEDRLRVQGEAGQIKIRSKSAPFQRISFDANGFAMSSANTFRFTADGATRYTDVVISFSGRIRSESGAAGGE